MCGHTIIFPQHPQTIANMLPPSIEEVVLPMCVVFVGDHLPTKKWLMEKATPLTVHGNKVHQYHYMKKWDKFFGFH